MHEARPQIVAHEPRDRERGRKEEGQLGIADPLQAKPAHVGAQGAGDRHGGGNDRDLRAEVASAGSRSQAIKGNRGFGGHGEWCHRLVGGEETDTRARPVHVALVRVTHERVVRDQQRRPHESENDENDSDPLAQEIHSTLTIYGRTRHSTTTILILLFLGLPRLPQLGFDGTPARKIEIYGIFSDRNSPLVL